VSHGIVPPNEYRIRAGDITILRQGRDIYLDDVPEGEAVLEVSWGCPENGVRLSCDDIDTLAALVASLRGAQLKPEAK
jgi:hypothetical protein